ncbi:MAG: imelysin family protein [Pseudomonadota bacterium]
MRGLILAGMLVVSPVLAVAQDEPTLDLAAITAGMIDGHILPAYEDLTVAAATQAESVSALCQTPSDEALLSAQAAFAGVVDAWSAVEFIRFGPAREDNRYERLFFWPDRNGRGLNQVQGAIASEDETVTTTESLQGKSVALQGLLALDYTLFGTGFETLAEGNDHRCAYAGAIAGAVAASSMEVSEAWRGDHGYAALMLSPGPDNALYRSEGEALQEILRSMSEQLQIVHDAKLVRVVGESPAAARSRRAPFWRSGQSIPSMIANAEAMLNLNEVGGFAERLPEQSQRFASTARFELGQIASRLGALQETGMDIDAIVTGEETHGQFAGVALPLAGAMRIIGEVYPAELGLTLGFNSLDGD